MNDKKGTVFYYEGDLSIKFPDMLIKLYKKNQLPINVCEKLYCNMPEMPVEKPESLIEAPYMYLPNE